MFSLFSPRAVCENASNIQHLFALVTQLESSGSSWMGHWQLGRMGSISSFSLILTSLLLPVPPMTPHSMRGPDLWLRRGSQLRDLIFWHTNKLFHNISSTKALTPTRADWRKSLDSSKHRAAFLACCYTVMTVWPITAPTQSLSLLMTPLQGVITNNDETAYRESVKTPISLVVSKTEELVYRIQ